MRSLQAGAIDELDEHAARGPRVQERDVALRSASRRMVDELDALRLERAERGREIVDDVAEVMERRLPALGEEARDPGLRVRRLDELDPRTRPGQEDGTDTLVDQVAHRPGLHPDDDPGLRFDLALVAVRRVLDRALLITALDPGERAPELLDPRELRERARLDVRRELLDEVRAAERVDRLGRARLLGDDLLRPQRDPR